MYKSHKSLFDRNDPRIDQINFLLETQLKKDKSFFLRQGDKKETHIFTEGGLIDNGITSLHNENNILGYLIRDICTDSKIEAHLAKHYEDQKWKLVQTMLFDANPSTSLHTDNIFLDSNPKGHLVGVLIAFKDMHIENGGISLYEYSKKEINDLYEPIYKKLPRHFKTKEEIYSIRGEFLETLKKHIFKAPIKTYLKKGEVVSWGSHVPHESLKGFKEKYISRYSVAAHYVPLHSKFETSLGRNSADFAERFKSEEFFFKN